MQSVRRAVLHVDDDPAILRVVGTNLRNRGYDVFSIDDSSRAIATLLEHHCRVAILDVDMPNEDGLEVLSRIKEFDGGIQVIMLTGLVSMNTVLESMRRGAEACFFKPVLDFDEFHHRLNDTFEKLEQWRHTLQELASRRQSELCETI